MINEIKNLRNFNETTNAKKQQQQNRMMELIKQEIYFKCAVSMNDKFN